MLLVYIVPTGYIYNFASMQECNIILSSRMGKAFGRKKKQNNKMLGML